MHILGIGTDIVECLRIAQMIERHGESFIQRIYTPHEITFCSSRKAATQHYAGRWAAKQAILKSLGVDWSHGMSWSDIEVQDIPDGNPIVRLGGVARDMCGKLGIVEIMISIAHCRTHATAYALALGSG